jgi:UDP-N-acetylglucosamine/UDP-N-acetylgalactosamine diphosphorylase
MLVVPGGLRQLLHDFGQEHVLAWWDQLGDGERRDFLQQLQALDFEQLQQLYQKSKKNPATTPSPKRILPVPVIRLGGDTREVQKQGEEALRQGEVAVLLVAGGQGSRLGFDHPKGMFPIGPVSNKSLFQIHAEKVLALRRRYGRPVPFLVMTSPATDRETRAFFLKNSFFGLARDEVDFFCQGTMPALDLGTGQLLMAAPGKLFLSPNGHGGTLKALAEGGLLPKLRQEGITQVFYFQVDNPLVKTADPVFLGHHLEARAEVSSKIVPKESPEDKLGNLVLVDGCCTMIEYSDLPVELARQTDDQGRLRLWIGSPAIHLFTLDFLQGMAGAEVALPFHLARKKVPYLDAAGNLVQPTQENALKFEMFIFDVLPLAQSWTVVETSRREEFMPLKNPQGPDSPETVRQALSDLAGDWLEYAGVRVPRRPDGSAAVPLEISPLFARDPGELNAKVDKTLHVEGPTYLR